VARRLRGYMERLAQTLGHADRREPLRGYLTVLGLPGARKGVEPMAALLAPEPVRQTTTSRCIIWWPPQLGMMAGTQGGQGVCACGA